MARIVPSTLTPNEKRWFTALIKKYQMRPIFLKEKLPRLQAAGWRNLYLDHVARAYVTALARPLRMNAIGWYEGEPIFIFLRGQIGPVIQQNAFNELQTITFSPCNSTSARPELKKAIQYNGHKNPKAGEWNPGHRVTRFGTIVVSKHGTTAQYPHVEKLLRVMYGIYQRTLPKHFREPNTLCPTPFRIAGTGYTRLAVLKSAASAIHTDDANGPGFASMTTLGTRPPYTGGTFCFVEFGLQIAIKPGDILIANTPAKWHCNIGAINGLKYSVVAYNKKVLGTSKKLIQKYRAKTGAQFLTKAERDDLQNKIRNETGLEKYFTQHPEQVRKLHKMSPDQLHTLRTMPPKEAISFIRRFVKS